MDQTDADLLAALRFAGASVTEADLPLLKLVHVAFGPSRDALLAPEVASLAAEPDLDPSRAPR